MTAPFHHRARKVVHPRAAEIRAALGDRSIVLVGLMGCGKSAIGRRLAQGIDLPFVDADEEIERAADQSISEIFSRYGETYFRDGERKVIARLLAGDPLVLATGGGAFMMAQTRERIADRGISIWLKADLAVLMRRVMRRDNRPLLRTPDPEGRMRELIAQRYPVYATADITVESRDVAHDVMVADIIEAVLQHALSSRIGEGRTP